MDKKIQLNNLIRKAKLTGLNVSKLLSDWQKDHITENEVAKELIVKLDKIYQSMLKQREFVMNQRSRQMSTTRDGFFHTELPPGSKKPKSRIVCCDHCLEPIALIKDPKKLFIPIKADDFESVMSDRDPYPPFHPRSVWPHINCRICGQRVATEEDKLLCSDGYLIIEKKPEKIEEETLPNQDLQAETVETSQPKS